MAENQSERDSVPIADSDEQRAYFQMRADVEVKAADNARHAAVARAHRNLAKLYLEKISGQGARDQVKSDAVARNVSAGAEAAAQPWPLAISGQTPVPQR